MPFPPAHLLLGAGAAELARGRLGQPSWKVWVVGAMFGVLPDLDTSIYFLLGADAPRHGVYTHNLVAAAAVPLAVGLVAGVAWALVAGAAYLSHLAADLLREGATTSVYLGWPVSSEAWAPLAPLFPVIPFDRHEGVLALYGTDPVGKLVEQTLIAGAFFALALAISAAVRKLRRARAAPPPRVVLPPRRRARR